jgi:hypothetical protein
VTIKFQLFRNLLVEWVREKKRNDSMTCLMKEWKWNFLGSASGEIKSEIKKTEEENERMIIKYIRNSHWPISARSRTIVWYVIKITYDLLISIAICHIFYC